jgi:hypothetical protein
MIIILLNIPFNFVSYADTVFLEDFEDIIELPPDAWYTYAPEYCFFEAGEGYQSEHSLGILFPHWYYSNAVPLNSPYVGLLPETDYTVSFYYKTEEVGMEGIEVYADFRCSNDDFYEFEISENETWTAATYDYTSGSMYSNGYLLFIVWEFDGDNGYAVLYIDDVKIEELDKINVESASLGKIKTLFN